MKLTGFSYILIVFRAAEAHELNLIMSKTVQIGTRAGWSAKVPIYLLVIKSDRKHLKRSHGEEVVGYQYEILERSVSWKFVDPFERPHQT